MKDAYKTIRVQPTAFSEAANDLAYQGYELSNSFVIDNKVFGIFVLANKNAPPKPKKKSKKKA